MVDLEASILNQHIWPALPTSIALGKVVAAHVIWQRGKTLSSSVPVHYKLVKSLQKKTNLRCVCACHGVLVPPIGSRK
jgi:hypothetical protein